ncbi:MAG TPA: hypothetical protein VGR00_10015, partial [Thermoanaerobaculia bacterium]|nr:hypothetical protein [Thermoanaerobaculia bacterium]
MNALGARLAVIGVFLAGFVSGAATLHFVRARFEYMVFHSPDPVARLIAHQLDRELKLTPAQKEVVVATIHDSRDELLRLRVDLMPKVIETFEKAQGRIASSLDEKQRERFEKIVSERRRL